MLVVDDDVSILRLVAEMLEDEGYETRMAENGRQALASLDGEPPSLVVLDMRMPVVDGWEFTRLMRERGFDIPILVMTAAQDARRWAQEIDAAGYIAKPFDIDQLIDAVRRTLSATEGDEPRSTLSILGRWFPARGSRGYAAG
ncbi:MAG: response regulator [Dehalococcoidia bacterium]|nr:response regulator [Dehalococcoidia bacterium]